MQDFILREKARSYGFRFLAACFYRPQADMFKSGLLQNLSDSLKKACPDAAVYAGEMIKLLPAYPEESLLVDYAKLFVGPAELVAAPYGSVYMEKERRVMGDSTIAVMDFYKFHGLVMDEEFKEIPDHIAVELEFMYYLAFKEVEALESSDTAAAAALVGAQEFFMNRFLRPWAGEFAEKMSEGAETGFYKALAGCLSAFIYKTDVHKSLPDELQAAAAA